VNLTKLKCFLKKIGEEVKQKWKARDIGANFLFFEGVAIILLRSKLLDY